MSKRAGRNMNFIKIIPVYMYVKHSYTRGRTSFLKVLKFYTIIYYLVKRKQTSICSNHNPKKQILKNIDKNLYLHKNNEAGFPKRLIDHFPFS